MVKCQECSQNILYEVLFCSVPTLETSHGKQKGLCYRQFLLAKLIAKAIFISERLLWLHYLFYMEWWQEA